MADIKIIGIGGTNGSGKDSLGQMLAERHGWLFVSVTDILRQELEKQNIPIERKNLRQLSAEWRRQRGLGVLVDEAYKKYQPKKSKYKGLVMSSLRNYGEADRIHELGGKMVWVDAAPEVRYKRIETRKRSAEDYKSYEEFLAEEQAEKRHTGDEATLNWQGVKERADIFLENNGNDIEAFKDQAEQALGLA